MKRLFFNWGKLKVPVIKERDFHKGMRINSWRYRYWEFNFVYLCWEI